MRAMRPESSLRTILVPRRLRFRLVLFLVRIWLLNAWPALNLPDAVLRNRLAAARLVLILGITCSVLHFYTNSSGSLAALSFLLEPACLSPRKKTQAGSTSFKLHMRRVTYFFFGAT